MEWARLSRYAIPGMRIVFCALVLLGAPRLLWASGSDAAFRSWAEDSGSGISSANPSADQEFDSLPVYCRPIFESRKPVASLVLFGEASLAGRYARYAWGGLLFVAIDAVLIVMLLFERRQRKRAQASLVNRFALELVVAELSTTLSSCPAARIDAEIERGLALIREAEVADRVCWFAIPEGGTTLAKISSAQRTGVASAPAQFAADDVPWIAERIARGENTSIGRLADLPPAANRDRHYLSQQWIQSIALVPSSTGTAAKGVLIVVNMDREREWPGALIRRLAVLGNLFGNALARKRAQEAEETSAQQFAALFERASLGIALEDQDGRILFANPALCAMLGHREEEMRAMNCSEFARAEDSEEDWALFQKLRTGLIESYRIEKRYVHPNGEEVWGNLHVSTLQGDHKEPTRMIAMVEDITERKAANRQVSAFQLELQQLTARLIQAQEEERQRISRELHDDIGQRLSMLIVALDGISRDLPVSLTTLRGELTNLMSQADELTTDVHQLSHQLHSSKLQHLGLKAALVDLSRQISEQQSIIVDLQVSELPPLPSEVQVCFYRIAQEALSNVLKHSGTAKVTISLGGDDHLVKLGIRDSGVGFDVALATSGLGLASMRERLRLVGGTLLVNSLHGQGTEITAQVPLGGDAGIATAS